jgi:hypothetical protein
MTAWKGDVVDRGFGTARRLDGVYVYMSSRVKAIAKMATADSVH